MHTDKKDKFLMIALLLLFCFVCFILLLILFCFLKLFFFWTDEIITMGIFILPFIGKLDLKSICHTVFVLMTIILFPPPSPVQQLITKKGHILDRKLLSFEAMVMSAMPVIWVALWNSIWGVMLLHAWHKAVSACHQHVICSSWCSSAEFYS